MAFTISSFVQALFEAATSFGGLMKCINFPEWLLPFRCTARATATYTRLCMLCTILHDVWIAQSNGWAML